MWIAVKPNGIIQSPYEDPLLNPDPGFVVGPTLWTLYDNDPIVFSFEPIVSNPFVYSLYICCASKDIVTGKHTLCNSYNLGLDPLNPEVRNTENDILIFSNGVLASKTIYREEQGGEDWIDAPGGKEIILMEEIFGYNGGFEYTIKRFRFFTGLRNRNKVFLTDPTGVNWNLPNPSYDFHNEGCFRYVYLKTGNNVYNIRSEDGWAGNYQGWKELVVSGIQIGEYAPNPPEQAFAPSDDIGISPLIHVRNCSGLNLEITKMILVGGFPTILLDHNRTEQKSYAKIWNNIMVKETIQGNITEIIDTPLPYFWDFYIPFDNTDDFDDFPPINF